MRNLACILFLSIASWCLWAGTAHRWSLALPTAYEGDGIVVLASLQAGAEGHLCPGNRLNPRLNAPAGATWADFPWFDLGLITLLGCLGKAIGLVAASNVALALSHITSALGFFFAARLLGVRRLFAMAGGLLWAFSAYHAHRGLGHIWMSFDWPVPLAVAFFVKFACDLPWEKPWHPWALAGGLALYFGQCYPYSSAMFLPLLVVAWFMRGGRSGLGLVALACACVGLTALVTLWPTIRLWGAHGGNPVGLVRECWMCEKWALRPVEMILPPWSLLAQQYLLEPGKTGATSESFSAYLGIAGILGLAGMVLTFLHDRGRDRATTVLVVICGATLVTATVNGATYLLGLLGITFWRASNRFSVWILAAALLWLARRLSAEPIPAFTRGKGAGAVGGFLFGGFVLGLAAFIALADQFHFPRYDDVAMARKIANDRAFASEVERSLPSDAMVFMLPVMTAFEGDKLLRCEPYDLFRPYIWTKRLRFSHGEVLGRPREQARMASLLNDPPGGFAAAVRAAGYDAVMISRGAYADGGSSVVATLTKGSPTTCISDAVGDFVCIPIPGGQVSPRQNGSGLKWATVSK